MLRLVGSLPCACFPQIERTSMSQTLTQNKTQTTTITANDIRSVMAQSSIELQAILHKASHLATDFHLDEAMSEISIFVLNDVISAIRLQVYCDDELVCEYKYTISDTALDASGPAPENPPPGVFPEDARIRLVVTRNPNQPKEYVDRWLSTLGWSPAKPLHIPKDAVAETYGTFVSGGFGVERQLLINPKFDRPVTASEASKGGKK
jgi:hypothetical protein